VILRDGTPLRLRAPTPADYDYIKAFYDGLSEDSLFQPVAQSPFGRQIWGSGMLMRVVSLRY